jgi:hypothetical protein
MISGSSRIGPSRIPGSGPAQSSQLDDNGRIRPVRASLNDHLGGRPRIKVSAAALIKSSFALHWHAPNVVSRGTV